MNIVEFKNIERAYSKDKRVLCGVSFAMKQGEVVGLLGKNGAGKTTLLHIAMGILEAQSGSVRLFGLDPRKDPLEVKRQVGYVSEDQILPDYMNVQEIIDFHRHLFPTWDDGLAAQLAERFDLAPRRKIKELSKGQARQVALLCAISHRPQLLILDEPAGGLDPAARREFLETSIQLLNDAGSTILFSSHHMTDVERMAARVVMIHEGRLLIDNDLDQLREDHCLVLIPKGDHSVNELMARVQTFGGCLGVRDRSDSLHAIFNFRPEQCRIALTGSLGIAGIRCEVIALEEMFIELAGGQS
jgi:ABC-type multidrug transport system ATPase subunit